MPATIEHITIRLIHHIHKTNILSVHKFLKTIRVGRLPAAGRLACLRPPNVLQSRQAAFICKTQNELYYIFCLLSKTNTDF
jgi:hypothetical protein